MGRTASKKASSFLFILMLISAALTCFQCSVFLRTQSILMTIEKFEQQIPALRSLSAPSISAGGEKKKFTVIDGTLPSTHELRTLGNIDTYPDTSSCRADLAGDDTRTTLVTQASASRSWILEEHCRRWKDPIVAVIAVRHRSRGNELNVNVAGWIDKCPHLKLIEYKLDEEQSKPGMYPVNILRNVGLDAVETSHVLVADVDFVPSDRLDETIRSTLKERHQQRLRANSDALEEEEALVVPAFERMLTKPCTSRSGCKKHLAKDSSFVPKTFQQLKKCVRKKNCEVFHNYFKPAHSSTRSEEWLNGQWYQDEEGPKLRGTRRRQIRSVKCFDNPSYEPYVVLRWCGQRRGQGSSSPCTIPIAPYYNELFHGYGLNKIQLVHQLQRAGYRFLILPQGFLTHYPHPLTGSRTLFVTKESDLQNSMKNLYSDFQKDIQDMYPDERLTVPFCPKEPKVIHAHSPSRSVNASLKRRLQM